MPNNGRADEVEFNEPRLGLSGATRHDCHGRRRFCWAFGAATGDAHAAVIGTVRLAAASGQPAPGRHPRGVGSP